MNWTNAWHGVGFFLLALDTLVAVFLTFALMSTGWEDWRDGLLWLAACLIAAFFWGAVCG
jgi:hypothetical protein